MAGVDDGEIFLFTRLQVFHAREQHARIADQRAARLEIHFAMTVPAFIDMREHRTHEFADSRRRFVVVRDAESTADIDVMNLRAVRFDLLDEVEQFVDGVEIRAHFRDLRTDMAVDPDHVEIRHRRGLRVGRAGIGESHAELVRLEARGNIRMRLGVDVGIHAQRHRRLLARRLGDFVQRMQFGNRFDVKAFHAGIECFAHFRRGLADAGEHGVFRLAARGQHARQFARRDDVKARAQSCEYVQHREVAIGFHGYVDGGAAAVAGIGVSFIRVGQRTARIHVEWCAELLGQRRGRNAFDLQHAFGARECGLSHEFSGFTDALAGWRQARKGNGTQRLFAGGRGFGCDADAGDFRLSSGESESGVPDVSGTSPVLHQTMRTMPRARLAPLAGNGGMLAGRRRERRRDGHIERSTLTTGGEQRAGGNGQSRYNRAHPEDDLHYCP